MRISGSHVVITGGSSGIGLAIARSVAVRGAVVSLIARGRERLDAAAGELRGLGATVHVRSADVSDQRAVETALAELRDAAGPCDILVCSAGLARPGRFLEMEDAVFREMVEVDYFGTLYPIRAVLPGMVERRTGSVVAISSVAGLVGFYGYSAYSPAKFAVRGLMESLRAELRPHGVHAAVVYPPDVDTPQLAGEEEHKPPEMKEMVGFSTPIRPEAVADAVLDGIRRRRFVICPDVPSRVVARFASIVTPALNRFLDRRISSALRRG